MIKKKYPLSLFLTIFSALQLGCSSHPEIKPYQTPQDEDVVIEQQFQTKEAIVFPEDVSDGLTEESAVDVIAENAEVPATAPVAVQIKKESPRAPASTIKNGYYVLAKTCQMMSEPSESSKSLGQVSSGKKIWLDIHDHEWLKAYKKSGIAYISIQCVNK